MAPQRAVYFFCADTAVDPVAGRVFQAATELYRPADSGITVDARPVLQHTDGAGNLFYFVRTDKVLSHAYQHYLPFLQRHFAACDFAGLVTWHAGQNAPDAVLPVHTTGDAETGYFCPASPDLMRNLLTALESNRAAAGLDEFRVMTEATHWSGVVYDGGEPRLLAEYPVPLVDIEIGSSPARWSDQRAAEVIARSLSAVFTGDGKRLKRLLCAGGVHFEPAFAAAALQTWDEYAFGVSHILANQWLVSGRYEAEDGQAKLEACTASILGGIDAVVFHDNLKGIYKDRLRALAQKHGIPAVKHQALRRPESIAWA